MKPDHSRKPSKSRSLAYLVHLVDSGATRNGALGLYVGRKMRGERVERLCCDAGCPFCAEEAKP